MPAFDWKQEKSKKYRWLIYGISGMGKTTTSQYLKGKTFLLSLDDSFHRIPFWQRKNDIWVIDPEKPIEDLNAFVEAFDPNKYDNLVIDNLSNLQKLFFIEKAKETRNGLDNKISDYNEWTNYLTRFIAYVFKWDINILVTAWEVQMKITDPSGQEFMQYGPDIRSNPRDFIMGQVDVIARLVRNSKTGNRGCILETSVDTYAKNRLDDRKLCKVEDLFKVGDDLGRKVETSSN